MIELVDAHIHLSDADYDGCVDELLTDAKEAGVIALVTNSMDLKTSLNDIKLSRQYPNLVYAAIGIHPWNVNVLHESELQDVLDLINQEKDNIVAIGEIGLDYKYEKIWSEQLNVFNEMLRLAETLNLPVIIHSRGTTEKIVDMLPSYNLKRVLLHWFSHPISVLNKAIEQGYYITEGPPAAYSPGIREVIEKVPLTNLLTETDGPVTYFKQPYNRQITKPSFIRYVVEAIADVKNIPVKVLQSK
jgi:TatD DNase family protein